MNPSKKNSHTKLALLAGTAALTAFTTQAHAQSADSLIDKLVDKGILSAKEAQDLRDDADKNFNTAFQAKTGMPDWVTGYKISGDFRGRFDGINYDTHNAPPDRDRFRYRLRFGIVASLQNDLEVGFRLTSSEPAKGVTSGGDPISGNTTFSGNGTKKFIYIDQAYAKWSPIHADGWEGNFTIGKMENPFVFSDIVFDADYTPEGGAVQLNYAVTDKHTLKFNSGAFMLNELAASSADPFMAGAQIRLDSAWSAKWQSSVGAGLLSILNSKNLATTAVGDQNAGNWRSGSGNLLESFNPFVLDSSLTYSLDKFFHYNSPFPIKLAGDYIQNPNANQENSGWSAGLTFGKAGKKGLWELSYRYKYLEANAWYEELVDSDTGAYYSGGLHNSPTGAGYASGTNIKGHVFKFVYSFTDSLSVGATYFLTELINKPSAAVSSDTGRLQVDASLKF
jgi:hypothetical protein